ncbi:GH25 family lysozyme [Aneurinibacillus tyrosinisolvens]|uniref:GH25 family lysozyme n=1 Tax=Aneurinibacillus tyrosinisolvens TaxID=1443435 RepID=UPI00069A81C8|nr:GH25 family lysozyme [Aneurinibacillus tyrosinisolvens]
MKGVDLSHWQGNVDFAKIKASGVQFVYVKATQSTTFTDPTFATNVKNARDAGMPIGAYHYAKPTAPLNLTEAKNQATFFVNTMKNSGLTDFGDVMPVLDLEEPSTVGTLTGDDLAAWARTFVDTVKQQTNRQVLLYTGSWFIDLYGGFNGKLSDLPLWVADYQSSTSPTLPPKGGWTVWTVWQYTDKGSVNGVTGTVDLDEGPASLEQLRGYIPPGAATGLASSNVSYNNVTLSWNATSATDSYLVTRDGVSVYSGTNTSFTDNTVSPKTTYTYNVISKNVYGKTTSENLTVTTKVAPPAVPANFTGISTSNTISLTWNLVTDADNYVIARNDAVVYTGSATTFVDSNLSPNTSYTYSLVAKNVSGVSSGTTTTIATKPPIPDNIENLTATSTTNNVSLSWNPSTYASSYDVIKNGDVIYSGSSTSFTDNALTDDTAYTYQVVAKNSSGESPHSETTIKTKIAIPAVPTNIKGSSSSNAVTLSWPAVAKAENYVVKRKGSVIYTGPNTTFTDLNLTGSTSYTYEIAAQNVSGTSNAASIVVATKTPIPTTPTGVTATSTTNSVSLSWAPSKYATSYKVIRSGVVLYQGSAISFKDVNVKANTLYTYTITASNAQGASPPVTKKIATKPITYIVTAKTTYAAYYSGNRAKVTVTVKTNEGKVVSGANVAMTIKSPSGSVTTMTGKTDASGNFISVYTTAKKPIGTYIVTAKTILNGVNLPIATCTFKTVY